MSRIGRKPVDVPDGVKISFQPTTVTVEGPLGKVSQAILRHIKVTFDAPKKKVLVERQTHVEQALMNHGTMRAHLQNMIQGVTKGFERKLRISGVGYTAKLAGTKLVLALGYSHPVELDIPPELKVTIPDPSLVVVNGSDRQKVGHFAAIVRSKRVVEPYNLKGIKYEEEVVKKKAGKTFVSGA